MDQCIPASRPIAIPAEFDRYHAQIWEGIQDSQFKLRAMPASAVDTGRIINAPKPPEWPVIVDPLYWQLKRQVKQAEATRAAVPNLSSVPWSAGHRWTQAQRRAADAGVRRAKKAVDAYRKSHRLGAPRKFWKPRSGASLSPKVAKRFDAADTAMWTWLVEPVAKQLRDIREHSTTDRHVLGDGGCYEWKRCMNREGLAQFRFIKSMRAA